MKSLFLFFWLSCFAALLSAAECKSQASDFDSPSQFRIGAGLFGGVYLHNATFSGLPGVPSCCPHYENGSGLGGAGAIFFQKPLSPTLSLSLWAGASNIAGRFSAIEEKTIILNDSPQIASIQHSIETSVTTLYFDAQFAAQFSTLFSGFVGLRGDFFAASSYKQKEELLYPETGSFETGSRIRNVYTGNLPGLNRGLISSEIGIRFEAPLNSERTYFIFPEISFNFGVAEIAGFASWSVMQVRAGASFGKQYHKNIVTN